MRPRATAFVVVFVIAAAAAWVVQRHNDLPRYGEPSFTVINGSSMKPHRLRGDETIATALSAIPDNDSGQPTTRPDTLLLVRSGPDGLWRQRFDYDASMHLVDPPKDQSLRNGDQLIVAPAPTVTPAGLARPASPGIPAQ
jgi:hypothetical protein